MLVMTGFKLVAAVIDYVNQHKIGSEFEIIDGATLVENLVVSSLLPIVSLNIITIKLTKPKLSTSSIIK